MSPHRLALVIRFAAVALTAIPAALAQGFYLVSKHQNYVQTAGSGSVENPMAPFSFSAEMASNGTLAKPAGTVIPLEFISGDDEDSYEVDVGFTTKTALDAEFPAGTYTFNGTGAANLSFSLSPERYPTAAPQIVGGTWSNGLLVLDSAVGGTITFSSFTDFATGGSIGHYGLSFESLTSESGMEEDYVSDEIFGLTEAAQAPTSFSVTAEALTAGGIYEGEISFDKVGTADETTLPGSGIVSLFGKRLSFFVVARASGTTPPAVPTIILPPADRAVFPGGAATISFTASMPGTSRNVMWFRNGTQINFGNGAKYGFDINSNGSRLQINSFSAADAGDYQARIVTDGGVVLTEAATLSVAAASTPSPSVQATAQTVAPGQSVTVTATTGITTPSFQWRLNGAAVTGETAATLQIADVQPAATGLYAVSVTSGVSGLTGTSSPTIVGVSASSKVIGTGQELTPTDIRHPNNNIFDQVLLTGVAEAITADEGQVTRTSFIDMDNDIVQVEFSGPGTLSLVLDAPSGPAAPVNYNQPTVSYMKGHAGIVITGADERTNVGVFSVGRATAFDPTGAYNILMAPSATNVPANNGSSLFVGHQNTVYGGVADIAFIAISSTNGKFGGLRASNATCFASEGHTGIYAPGIQFTGPVFVGDISAFDDATPVFVIGSATDARITGGDLAQANGRAIRVGGIVPLNFTAGVTSHGVGLAAQVNQARFEQGTTDVTINMLLGTQ